MSTAKDKSREHFTGARHENRGVSNTRLHDGRPCGACGVQVLGDESVRQDSGDSRRSRHKVCCGLHARDGNRRRRRAIRIGDNDLDPAGIRFGCVSERVQRAVLRFREDCVGESAECRRDGCLKPRRHGDVVGDESANTAAPGHRTTTIFRFKRGRQGGNARRESITFTFERVQRFTVPIDD